MSLPNSAFNPFGDLRNLSLTPGWAKGVYSKPEVNLTPGAGTKFFTPPEQPATPVVTPPATPVTPTGIGTQVPGTLFGVPFGNNYNPGLPSIFAPSQSPQGTRSPLDQSYPFPNYLALLGIGNNLL